MNKVFSEVVPFTKKEASLIRCASQPESVEELCDHMALIHRSNKLLDGKVSEIKRQFKSNTYEVGVESSDNERLRKELSEMFQTREARFKSINNDLKLEIQLPENASPNDLLIFLAGKGRINHFVEMIPSVNDIFIKTVTTNA